MAYVKSDSKAIMTARTKLVYILSTVAKIIYKNISELSTRSGLFILGTCSHGIVAGQLGKRAMLSQFVLGLRYLQDLLERCQSSFLGSCDRTAGIIETLRRCTCCYSLLESILISPAVDKIPMESVPRRVAHCVHPIFKIGKRLRVEEELQENGIYRHGVRFRADALIILSGGRIRHLDAVLSIPTTQCNAYSHAPLTWLLWSGLSKFFPSQQDGKNT